ncbi:hypothetical protein PHYPSEUDO_014804 [Phytophthora pseudosyringae]|uniref:Uncharacterized protein n=1 Tax=Phytophthora pseudosyringae TaxID=221518 RepID=A0A8T1W4M5_9STRA|nr:hypothetical protein PHYPSEUDO_014804 [Phytophthora pseudosyringae]
MDQILRCFPHCCPYHIGRSYCGSPVEVLVHFSNLPQFTDHDDRARHGRFNVANVFVFGRFEKASGEPLPNNFLSLRYLRGVSQSEENPEASWVEGVRHHHAPGSRNQHASATFMLNGQPFDKWYYHWDSGANKMQRSTQHVLKAYVLYLDSGNTEPLGKGQQTVRSPVQKQQTTDGMLKLLCVVVSTPFTLISYRRSTEGMTAIIAASLQGPAMRDIATEESSIPPCQSDTADPGDSELHVRRQSRAPEQKQQLCTNAGTTSDRTVRFSRPQEEHNNQDRERGSEQLLYDKFRELQDRVFRLHVLTPSDAALAASALHNQFQSQEPRIVFNRKRHRCGGGAVDVAHDYNENDQDGPNRLSSTHPAAIYEVKLVGPLGIAPPTVNQATNFEKPERADARHLEKQQQEPQCHRHQIHQLTDLAIVHFFASHATTNWTDSLGELELALASAVERYWKYDAGRALELARVLIAITSDEQLPGVTCSRRDTEGSLDGRRLGELVFLLAEVCIWTLSSGNLEELQGMLSVCQPLLLGENGVGSSGGDRMQLCTVFLDCVGRCWGSLDRFLQTRCETQTAIHSVRGLADTVLGVVFSDPNFEELRPELRTILQQPSLWLAFSKNVSTSRGKICGLQHQVGGWQGFVAQMREGYLRDQNPDHCIPSHAGIARWTGEWLLEPGSLSVRRRPSQGVSAHQAKARESNRCAQMALVSAVPSVWTSCLALSQLLHLKLVGCGDPLHTVYVQAESSLLSRDMAWLRLICDGRVRVAPVMPNGLTSLVGGSSSQFGGDYVAYHQHGSIGGSTDVHECNPFCIEFYWWPLGNAPKAPLEASRIVVTLKVSDNGAFMQGQICLERGFVDREMASAPRLELWSPRERVEAVDSWHLWLLIEGVYTRT